MGRVACGDVWICHCPQQGLAGAKIDQEAGLLDPGWKLVVREGLCIWLFV
jgi:hypothetical protein